MTAAGGNDTSVLDQCTGLPNGPSSHGPGPQAEEWETLAAEWAGRDGRRLWRDASDLVNRAWLERCSLQVRGCRVLKTDLFDEAFGGGLLDWMIARGADAIGCDVSSLAVARASARQPQLRAFTGDVRHLPLPNASMAVVLSNSTLDHFESLDQVALALRELGRVLRPGGRLLLSMDNPCNPLLYLRSLTPGLWRRAGVAAFRVGATCRPGRLQRMVEEAGFLVEDTGAVFHSPRFLVVWICNRLEARGARRLPGWLSWLLRRLESLGRSPLRYLTGHFITISAKMR